MSFPAYEYRHSGVDWLGDIPKHWTVMPLKRCIERNDGGVWGDDTIVLRSTEQSVDGDWRIDEPAKRKLSRKEIESALLLEGDLLLTKSSGSALHIGKTTIVNAEIADLQCCYSNFMQRLRTSSSLIPKLAWYVMNNDLARRQFDFLANSTTGLANLNATMIGQVVLPVGPPDEQKAISSFLDVETSKIDGLVSEQRRLIELLKEKRQAVISHAVTKGLNPNAPMKPSGIQWLGDVPQHWKFGPLKRFWEVVDCKHVTVPFLEEGYPVASVMEVRTFELDLSRVLRTDEENYQLLIGGDRKPQKGDVIYCRNTANTGTSAYVGTDEPICIGQDVVLIKSRQQNGRFLNFTLHGPEMAGQLTQAMVGSTFKRINVADIRELIVTCPPTKEQDEIVEYMDAKTSHYDTLIAEAERAIELFQERRTALISAAVTGKIDVRGVIETAAP
jgi:type I restriction enzyme, S subunit